MGFSRWSVGNFTFQQLFKGHCKMLNSNLIQQDSKLTFEHFFTDLPNTLLVLKLGYPYLHKSRLTSQLAHEQGPTGLTWHSCMGSKDPVGQKYEIISTSAMLSKTNLLKVANRMDSHKKQPNIDSKQFIHDLSHCVASNFKGLLNVKVILQE